MTPSEFVALRAGMNLTQKALADLLGRSVRAIRQYESGFRAVPRSLEVQLQGLKALQFVEWVASMDPDLEWRTTPELISQARKVLGRVA